MLIKRIKKLAVLLAIVFGGIAAVYAGAAVATMLNSNGDEGSNLAGDFAFLFVLPGCIGSILGVLAFTKIILKKMYDPRRVARLVKITAGIYILIAASSTVINKLASN